LDALIKLPLTLHRDTGDKIAWALTVIFVNSNTLKAKQLAE